jgi:hypothetical protein
MSDLAVPVGYFGLDEVLQKFVQSITAVNAPGHDEVFEKFVQSITIDTTAREHWDAREDAIEQVHAALCGDALKAVVRDPASGQMFRLTPNGWRFLGAWRNTIVGGVVHSSIGEEFSVYNGRRVLVEQFVADAWLEERRPKHHDARPKHHDAPGPKPGVETAKDKACAAALAILNDDAERPPKRKGRQIELAEIVRKKLGPQGEHYKVDSIRKMISPTVRGWQEHNPDK